MLLPDGRNVDVCTPHGAAAFIEAPGSFEFFTQNIESVDKIREKAKRKGGKLSAKDKRTLEIAYLTAEGLGEEAEPKVFAKIPKAEIECFMDHVIEQIANFTEDPKWVRTGVLSTHDQMCIHPCMSMFMHAVPTRLAFDNMAFERPFFGVLSKLVASRKAPLMPCNDLAETIAKIVTNAMISVVFNKEIVSSVEAAFKKLESCGMLAQYIRCTMVPELIGDIGVLKVYDELIGCPALIKKKFADGQPCGDLVSDILSGEDCNSFRMKNVEVIKKLKTIASFADIMQAPKQKIYGKEHMQSHNLNICRYCSKTDYSEEFQNSLKACARCKSAHYCSKECQKADWKSHKKNCKPTLKADEKAFVATQNATLNFAKRNYVDILEDLVEVCDETGLSKSELMLELDFTPNAKGICPALEDPPDFEIKESRGYFEGSRPNLPDWFLQNEDGEKNIDTVVAAIKDHFGRVTKDHLLCLARQPGGVSCYRIQLSDSDTGKQMFSQEAVDAARSAINDDDYDGLEQIFNENTMRAMRRSYGGQMPSNMGGGMPMNMPGNADLDRIRMMLNNNFGADFLMSGDMR